jgi:hypothetical protein
MPSTPTTWDREIRALASAGADHPHAQQALLVLTREQIPPDVPSTIRVQPAYEWLLANETEEK